MLILDLANTLGKINTFVHKSFFYIRRIYCEFVTDILFGWRNDYTKIEGAIYDKTYSGECVLDMISRNEFTEILESKKLSIIISGMWQGKYETHSFLNYSLNFQIIKTIFLKQVGVKINFRTS